jgi:hypothetical protein
MPPQKAGDRLGNRAWISHHQEVIHPGKQDLFSVRGNRLKGLLRPVEVKTTLGPEDIKDWLRDATRVLSAENPGPQRWKLYVEKGSGVPFRLRWAARHSALYLGSPVGPPNHSHERIDRASGITRTILCDQWREHLQASRLFRGLWGLEKYQRVNSGWGLASELQSGHRSIGMSDHVRPMHAEHL